MMRFESDQDPMERRGPNPKRRIKATHSPTGDSGTIKCSLRCRSREIFRSTPQNPVRHHSSDAPVATQSARGTDPVCYMSLNRKLNPYHALKEALGR